MTTPLRTPMRHRPHPSAQQPPRPAAPAAKKAPQAAQPGAVSRRIHAAQDWLDARPGIDYLMIRILVFCLTGIGVVMVMSSSMTWSIIEGSTVWGAATKQAIMVGAGLFFFWLFLKLTPQAIRRAAPWTLIGAYALLVLVLVPSIGTGREEVGSQSWINLGFFSLQPSEVSKFAVAIFGAHFLANKRHNSNRLGSYFVRFVGISLAGFALILAEGDLGMGVAFLIVVAACLFFAGVHRSWVYALLVGAVLATVAILTSGGFRSHRFHVYFDALLGHFDDTRGVAFQSYQGFLSLADGSLLGVGLGQSRAKWFYLPEAHNDFIFAIIGEELGLWGGLVVIALFAALAFFGYRTARRAQDQFQALLAATITTMVCAQAFINIAYVVGLLPVTGIQLPMISAGGTSAVVTLSAMGVLANIARHEPEAISAMQSYGRPLFDRLLFIAEPLPPQAADAPAHSGEKERIFGRRPEAAKRAEREARFGQPVTVRRRPVASEVRRAQPSVQQHHDAPRNIYAAGSPRVVRSARRPEVRQHSRKYGEL